MGCSNSNEIGNKNENENENESEIEVEHNYIEEIDIAHNKRNPKKNKTEKDLNEITMHLLIVKDINDKDDFLEQDIYFLDNKTDLFNGNNNHNNLPELNSSNVEMYINGKKKKISKMLQISKSRHV